MNLSDFSIVLTQYSFALTIIIARIISKIHLINQIDTLLFEQKSVSPKFHDAFSNHQSLSRQNQHTLKLHTAGA